MTTHSWRRVSAHLAVALAVTITPLTAWGWAAASHVYVAKHTDKMAGQVDGNELCNRLYGSNLVDMFNTIFTIEGQTLAAVLHNPGYAASALPYFVAMNDVEKALAFGFASHNEAWGTDRTAHWDGVTFGHGEGYVVAKAKVLAELLRGPIAEAEIQLDEGTLQFVAHILIEHSVDLLIASADPAIGVDMMASTACPQPAGVDVIVRGLVPAYDGILPPAYVEQMIRDVEPQFRSGLLVNGWALTQPNAKELMAGAIADLARGFLPPPLPSNEVLLPLIVGALDAGMFVTAPDYQDELDATTGWVNGQMSVRKITP
jgi:hypothetical protein